MIYVDTSVALAHLLAEDRRPPKSLWQETLVSSRLLEYEVWTRIHARRLAKSHSDLVRGLLASLAFIELAPNVLSRVIEPFPNNVRTLDAMHLASLLFLRERDDSIALATYDDRQRAVARRLKIPFVDL